MISNLLKKVFFGSRNDRLLKQYGAIVSRINALEAQTQALSDDGLRAKTAEFRERIAKGESLDDLLPEAFAVCREGAKRALGMRHFDVQLVGGITLHQGKISEMRTGEGKTLVATLPAYLNALSGNGVHVLTVNDYLVQRDAATMGKLYNFLGLTCGVNIARWRTTKSNKPTPATSPTAPTTNSALTICATTWCTPPTSACNAR